MVSCAIRNARNAHWPVFVDCASTTPGDNFEDDALVPLVNQWFTSNIGKVRKTFKCYEKSFCLSEKPFSYNALHCLFS